MDITALGTTGSSFTRRDALSAGLDRRDLTKLVRAGQISRIANGVYLIGADLPNPRAVGRALNAVLSHHTAAAWLGADVPFAADALHLAVPRNRGRRADAVPGVRLHRADLGADEVLVVRGACVTAPARVLRDVAQLLPLEQAVAIGDSLCRRAGLTREAALAAALRLPRGTGKPAAIRAASLLDFRAESMFESVSRVRLAVAGLPAPVPQLNVYSEAGIWIARVDFAWEELRVVLECDGFAYHGDRDAFQRDRRRWSALTRAGWRVVVVTWQDVMGDPTYLVELMADVLGR
jgi:hypothetical protein